MYKNCDISSDKTLLDALTQMDVVKRKLLIILEDGKFVGLLSIGDIQRAIIKNLELTCSIKTVIRKGAKILYESATPEQIRSTLFAHRMEFCPILNEINEVVEMHFWEDYFGGNLTIKNEFNIPVVVMAGGLGTRLKPMTNVLPKPLIAIGEHSMLEEIIDRFTAYGCNKFFLSLNYKADFIEYYIKSIANLQDVNIEREELPLGTAGSLTNFMGLINETFFLSNCDILLDCDYSEILEYHIDNNCDVTVVSALKSYPIPYGIISTHEDGTLKKIDEKPINTVKVNTGMYILEPHVLELIPVGKMFNMTDLINQLILSNGKIGVFPVSENSWTDIGNWPEYLNYIQSSERGF